jgi:hypothetical protein
VVVVHFCSDIRVFVHFIYHLSSLSVLIATLSYYLPPSLNYAPGKEALKKGHSARVWGKKKGTYVCSNAAHKSQSISPITQGPITVEKARLK